MSHFHLPQSCYVDIVIGPSPSFLIISRPSITNVLCVINMWLSFSSTGVGLVHVKYASQLNKSGYTLSCTCPKISKELCSRSVGEIKLKDAKIEARNQLREVQMSCLLFLKKSKHMKSNGHVCSFIVKMTSISSLIWALNIIKWMCELKIGEIVVIAACPIGDGMLCNYNGLVKGSLLISKLYSRKVASHVIYLLAFGHTRGVNRFYSKSKFC